MNELWLTTCFEKVNSIISRATRRLLESMCFEFYEFLICFWIYMWLLLIMLTFYLPSPLAFSIFHPVLIILVFSPFFGWVSYLFCPLCIESVLCPWLFLCLFVSSRRLCICLLLSVSCLRFCFLFTSSAYGLLSFLDWPVFLFLMVPVCFSSRVPLSVWFLCVQSL